MHIYLCILRVYMCVSKEPRVKWRIRGESVAYTLLNMQRHVSGLFTILYSAALFLSFYAGASRPGARGRIAIPREPVVGWSMKSFDSRGCSAYLCISRSVCQNLLIHSHANTTAVYTAYFVHPSRLASPFPIFPRHSRIQWLSRPKKLLDVPPEVPVILVHHRHNVGSLTERKGGEARLGRSWPRDQQNSRVSSERSSTGGMTVLSCRP